MKLKKSLLIAIIALSVLVLDQLTKLLVAGNMQLGGSIPLIKNIFHLTYIQNTGAAFGVLKGFNIFLIILSIAVLAAIFCYYKKIAEKDRLVHVLVALILGGIIGNLIDRIRLGYVIDFLDFRIWPAFNVADSCITIAVIWLIIYLWKK